MSIAKKWVPVSGRKLLMRCVFLWRTQFRWENHVVLRDFLRYSQFSRKFSEKSTSRAQFERYVYDLLTNVVPELKTVQKSYHMTTFRPLWKFRSKTRRDRNAAICKYYEQRTGSEGTPTHRDSLGRVSEKRFFPAVRAPGRFPEFLQKSSHNNLRDSVEQSSRANIEGKN